MNFQNLKSPPLVRDCIAYPRMAAKLEINRPEFPSF